MKIEFELSEKQILELYCTYKGKVLGATLIDELDIQSPLLDLPREIIYRCENKLPRNVRREVNTFLTLAIMQAKNTPEVLDTLSDGFEGLFKIIFEKDK